MRTKIAHRALIAGALLAGLASAAQAKPTVPIRGKITAQPMTTKKGLRRYRVTLVAAVTTTGARSLDLALKLPRGVLLERGKTHQRIVKPRRGVGSTLRCVVRFRGALHRRIVGFARIGGTGAMVLQRAFVVDIGKPKPGSGKAKRGRDGEGRPIVIY